MYQPGRQPQPVQPLGCRLTTQNRRGAGAFASTQVAAATLAARQQDSTGSPVRGAMMWCSLIPPRCQDRTPVLEVASPLSEITIAWLGSPPLSSGVNSTLSRMPTRQPPGGGWPATLMSPPRLTSTPQPVMAAIATAARSAASALAVAPRSSITPAGTLTTPLAWSSSTVRQPAAGAGGWVRALVSRRATAKSWS